MQARAAIALICLIFLPLLTGCLSERLTAHMDFLSKKSLASYHVKTPDPNLNDPPMGQRILVSWSLPKSYLFVPKLHIRLTVRFWNHEETTVCLYLRKLSGSYIYTLINENYFEKCGIQTYKLELIGNGEVLESWHHQLWKELISIDSNS